MVRIRLSRMGKKKRPFYRIVAMNIRAPQQGHVLAQVGIYDPINSQVRIDEEAALLWLNRGAVMSDTVKALFDSQGVLALRKGLEPRVRDDALTKEKPKRRRKIAAAQPAETKPGLDDVETTEPAPAVESGEVVAETPAETAEVSENQDAGDAVAGDAGVK